MMKKGVIIFLQSMLKSYFLENEKVTAWIKKSWRHIPRGLYTAGIYSYELCA